MSQRWPSVGEGLGLPPIRLRELALGGLLHDMGQLTVPARFSRSLAWTPERTLALLHQESGSAFDPACVAALEGVLSTERAPERLSPAVGGQAAFAVGG